MLGDQFINKLHLADRHHDRLGSYWHRRAIHARVRSWFHSR
jgi:hypothetical protein